MTTAAADDGRDGVDGLGGAVAGAGPALVRRPRAGFTDDPVVPPLRLLAALDLGGGRYLAVVADAAGSRWTVPLVRTTATAATTAATTAAGSGGLRRAVAGDGVAQALVARLAASPAGTVATNPALGEGTVHVTTWFAEPATGERAVAVDQTNESVVVGERAVVKWTLRHPPDGVDARHPAPDRLAALAAAGFSGTPRPWGAVTLTPPGATQPLLLATVVAYLPGALDGWDWAVADVRAHARGELDLAAALAPAAAVGDLVARVHLALAAGGTAPLRPQDAATWAAQARADLDEACRSVDGPEGARLAARAPRIAAGLLPLAGAAGTPVIDVHGDLHVGQVLRHPGPEAPGGHAYAVVDLDGNPVLAPAERARRRPVAVDVAGMLASLDHVGRVVLRSPPEVDAAVVERWIGWSEGAFLDRYRATLARHGAGDLLDERLLLPLRLHQECREFLYAVRHLPHWRYVPDGALGRLLDDRG